MSMQVTLKKTPHQRTNSLHRRGAAAMPLRPLLQEGFSCIHRLGAARSVLVLTPCPVHTLSAHTLCSNAMWDAVHLLPDLQQHPCSDDGSCRCGSRSTSISRPALVLPATRRLKAGITM